MMLHKRELGAPIRFNQIEQRSREIAQNSAIRFV